MKKFGSVVLHIGCPKTGSTSIQTFLNSGRQAFLAAGHLAYPPGHWHAQLSSCFSNKPDQCYFNVSHGLTDLDTIRKRDALYFDELCQWLDQVRPCKYLIFSYEGFLYLDTDALERFKTFALKWSDEIIVVAYVRPPLSFAASALSQQAKTGVLFQDLPYVPWKTIIQIYLSVFNKDQLILRKFARDVLAGGDVVDDFMHVLGITSLPSELKGCREAENESVSDVGMLLSIKIKELLEKRKVTVTHGAFFDFLGKHLSLIPGNRFKLEPELCSRILVENKEDIEYLHDEFGISLAEPIIENPGSMSRFEQDRQLVNMIDGIAEFITQVTFGGTRHSDFAAPEFNLLNIMFESESHLTSGGLLSFILEFSLAVEVSELVLGIRIFDGFGRLAFSTNTQRLGQPLYNLSVGTYCEQWAIVADLPKGDYAASFVFSERLKGSMRKIAWYDKLVRFSIGDETFSTGYTHLPVTATCSRISDRVVRPLTEVKGTLRFGVVPVNLVSGETVVMSVVLKNNSNQDWISLHKYPINLSYHWLDEQGGVVVFDGVRTPLPGGVLYAGTSVEVTLMVKAPDALGRYRLCAMPVQEFFAWFNEIGFLPGEAVFEIVTQDDSTTIFST